MDMKLLGKLAPMVMGGANDMWNQLSSWAALAMNQQRLDEALGLNANLLNGPMVGGFDVPFIGNIGGSRDASLSMPGRLQAFSDTFGPKVSENYQNTLTNLSNMRAGLIGSGDQERKDINTRFDSTRDAASADAIARGLTSSTLPYNATSAIERGRSDAIGGLEERLRQQRMAFEGYSLQQGNSAFANELNSLYTLLTNPMQAQLDLTNNRIGILNSVTDEYPNQTLRANIMGNLGAGMAPPASMPDTSGAIWGGALGGVGTGAGIWGAKAISGACVSAKCWVRTPEGNRRLRDVEIGDFVMTPNGFKRVIARDIGAPQATKASTWLRFELGDHKARTTSKLVISGDHTCQGTKATQVAALQAQFPSVDASICWAVATKCRPPKLACDLWVEGGGQYAVNDVYIDSMLERSGIPLEDLAALGVEVEGFDAVRP